MNDITVIMPSLNVVNYIGECMESVVNQSFKNMEILCIDAGSTDGTLEILAQYAQNDPRIKLIHSKVKSYGYQVNLGISMASGKYIGIVETDDFVRPDMYEILYHAINGTALEFVKTNYDEIIDAKEGYLFHTNRIFEKNPDMYDAELDSAALLKAYLSDVTLWKGIYRKKFLQDAQIHLHESPGAANQDMNFIIQVLGRARSGCYLDKSLYCYRLNRPGASSVDLRCFANIRNEIVWAMNEQILQQERTMHQHAGMLRYVSSFLENYDYVLCKSHFDWKNPEIFNVHTWFKDNMDKWLAYYNVDLKTLNHGMWEQYRLAIDTPEKFAKNLQENAHKAEEKIDKIVELKEFVLFGFGKIGFWILRECCMRKIYPIAITDNNETLWGKNIGGIPLLSPRECMRKCKDVKYLIANSRSKDDIFNQLVSGGIPKSQIHIY